MLHHIMLHHIPGLWMFHTRVCTQRYEVMYLPPEGMLSVPLAQGMVECTLIKHKKKPINRSHYLGRERGGAMCVVFVWGGGGGVGLVWGGGGAGGGGVGSWWLIGEGSLLWRLSGGFWCIEGRR